MSIIFHRKVAGSPLCDMEAYEGLLSIFLSVCLSFLTPLLVKKASEHLNDQNSATWLSAPALSNLDGYVSASERGRHGQYTYTTQTHTHTRTHIRICPQVRRRFSRQANASRHLWQLSGGRKVEKCTPQWRCSQSYSCPKPAAICSVRHQRAKGQSLFMQLSLIRQLYNLDWKPFYHLVIQETTVLEIKSLCISLFYKSLFYIYVRLNTHHVAQPI